MDVYVEVRMPSPPVHDDVDNNEDQLVMEWMTLSPPSPS